MELARYQREHGLGIFRCQEYKALSDFKVQLPFKLETTAIGDMKSPTIDWGWGPTYANAAVFKRAWKVIIDDGRYRHHDWVVKVDPDAVFFAERLRQHLKQWSRPVGRVYVKNWNQQFGLLGPLEVVSRDGWELLEEKFHVCSWEEKEPSGEDGFLAACLNKIGVQPREDLQILENHKGLKCYDGWKAAFHPHKTMNNWLECFRQARPGGVM